MIPGTYNFAKIGRVMAFEGYYGGMRGLVLEFMELPKDMRKNWLSRDL